MDPHQNNIDRHCELLCQIGSNSNGKEKIDSTTFSGERKCLLCNGSVYALPKDENALHEVQLRKKVVMENLLNVSPTELKSLEITCDSYLNEIEFCDACSIDVTVSASLHEKIQKCKNEMISKIINSIDKEKTENNSSFTEKIRHFICSRESGGSGQELKVKKRKFDDEVLHKKRKSARTNFERLGNDEYVNEPICISVLEKEKRISRKGGREYYYLFLVETRDNQKEKVEALSFDNKFVKYFEEMQVGCTYEIKGNIKRVQKNLQKDFVRHKSELSWEYKFWGIHTLLEVDNQMIINTDPGQEFYDGEELLTIPLINNYLSTEKYRQQFKYKLVKNVELVSGYINRYLGCVSCQKGNPELINERHGIYRCLSCHKKGTFEEVLDNFMIIHNMVIRDSDGTELNNIVCYNDTVRDFLKKESKDFIYDDELESIFKAQLGSKINLRLSSETRPSGYSSNGYQIVAKSISVQRSSDEEAQVDPSPFFTKHVVGVKGLNIECRDHQDCDIEPERDSAVYLESQIHYDLCSKPVSGYALIINVVKYGTGQEDREGSTIDVKNVLRVLKNLNFKVFGNRQDEEFGLKDLREKIKKFKRSLRQDKISACLVFVMGHGYNDYLKLSGNDKANINKMIIEQFSTRKFNAFALKPKIFLFNMCRPFPEDEDEQLSTEWKNVPTPDIKNALFCFSTPRGHYSARKPKLGSFFVNLFVGGLKQHAASEDLETILKEVQNEMEKHKQEYVIEFSDGSTKNAILMPSMPFGIVFKKFFFKIALTDDEKPESELDYEFQF